MFPLPLPAALLAEATPLGGTTGPDMTRYLVVCGGLLLLVGVLGFAFRKLVSRTLQARAAQRSMQVMDVLPLGGKHKLCVVRCYDRTFLIGVGEKELSSIAELDPVIAPASESAPTRADLQAFSSVLERLRGKPAARAASPAAPAPVPAAASAARPAPASPALAPVTLQPTPRPVAAGSLSKEGLFG